MSQTDQMDNSSTRADDTARADQPWRISRRVAGELVFAIDALAIFLAGVVTYYFYPVFVQNTEGVWLTYLMLLTAAVFIAAPVFQSTQLYQFGTVLDPRLRDIWQMFVSWTIVCGAVIAVAFLLGKTAELSRGWFLLWYVLGGGAIALSRWAGSAIFTAAAKRGAFNRPTIVYGTRDRIEQLLETLKHSSVQMNVVRVFEDDTDQPSSNKEMHEKVLAFAQKNGIENIFLAMTTGMIGDDHNLLQRLRTLPANIYLGPDEFSLKLVQNRQVNFGNLIFAELARKPLQDWDYVIKSIEDRVIAGLALFVLWPFLLLVAIAIRLDSNGPSLFRQKRFGFNNELILVYKFRTMSVDKEDPTGQRQTVPNDPRVTRVGRFLRAWSLDELPQLINVLQGRMSIVGPRAHVPSMLAGDKLYHEAIDVYASRHRVKPGITGLAQINGYRGVTDTIDKAQKRVEYDLFYIDNWSLLLDIKIIMLTPFAVLRQHNAY